MFCSELRKSVAVSVSHSASVVPADMLGISVSVVQQS